MMVENYLRTLQKTYKCKSQLSLLKFDPVEVTVRTDLTRLAFFQAQRSSRCSVVHLQQLQISHLFLFNEVSVAAEMGLFWSPNVWQRIFHEKDPVSPFLNISSDSLFSFLLFNPVGSVPFLKSCVMLDFLFYDFLSYSSLCVCCRCLKLSQWMRCKRNSAQLYPIRAQIIWTCLDPCSVFYTLKHFLIFFCHLLVY